MLGGAAGAAGLAVLPRGRAEERQPALPRLLDFMAPGTDALPGARAMGVARAIGQRIESTPASLRARLDALLAASARMPLDETALAALNGAHPDAMAWLTHQLFEILYGSARHGGVGERRAFRMLDYA